MEPTEHNRRAWDDLHRSRTGSGGREAGLPVHVRRALADLNGKRVLAIQADFGTSAAELAELGATVTAVDSSTAALEAARERWPRILWIEGEVQSLPRELRRGRFDLVYAAWNTDWVDDLAAWASGIASALRSGGDVLVYDEHPAARAVDGLMHWREDYFHEGERRNWRLGQIVTALARAGFDVRALEEYPQQPGNARHHDARIPGTFLLHAQRR
jgi:2-polyprenyl-3-methyl-5-hydroxy-6-metoxy-1,4-benzoquinol methylase